MRKFLYIGPYSHGTTSKMRADVLKGILSDWEFVVIDIDIPKHEVSRIWRSLGFRYIVGPLITNINNFIRSKIERIKYDIIWIDKAIFIDSHTTQVLRSQANILIHYTPDMAFKHNRSRLFYDNIKCYDWLVTTKIKEVGDYTRALGKKDKILYVTQGFDKSMHCPLCSFEEKSGVGFVGLNERSREIVIQHLIDNGITVKLAGMGWKQFVNRNRKNKHLIFERQKIFGKEYVKFISSCHFALGLLSKKFPELHTTRTFEIPACKTALITENNDEIASFYTDDEVLFYTNLDDLVLKIHHYLVHKNELEILTEMGYLKVVNGGYDYESILRKVIAKIYE